jgi:Methyltransferase domain
MNLRHFIRRVLRWLIETLQPSLLHYGKVNYMSDGLLTSNFFGLNADDSLQKALRISREEFKDLHSLYHSWRLYIVAMFLESIFLKRQAEGKVTTFVECGVGMGFTNHFSQNFLMDKYGKDNVRNGLTYVGFDTFEGLDRDLMTESEWETSPDHRKQSYGGQTQRDLERRFSSFGNCRLIKGSIPNTFSLRQLPVPDLLHVDLNHASPEVSTLLMFIPMMQSGSVVILDDYGFPDAFNQRKALDEVVDTLNLSQRVITLPTGQGMIFI